MTTKTLAHVDNQVGLAIFDSAMCEDKILKHRFGVLELHQAAHPCRQAFSDLDPVVQDHNAV